MLTNRKCSLNSNFRPRSRTDLKSLGRGVVDHGTADLGYTTVYPGEVVLLVAGYSGGGTAERLYRREGPMARIKLGSEDYSVTANWSLEAADTEQDHGSADGSTAITTGQTVKTAAAYANGGLAERLYEYLGEDDTIDLSAEDYSVTTVWQLQAIATEEDYDTDDNNVFVDTGQTVLLAGGYAGGGTAGSVYKRVASGASVDLGAEDYSVTANWSLEGTNAAFTGLSTANRDIFEAVPDPAKDVLDEKITKTTNRAEGVIP